MKKIRVSLFVFWNLISLIKTVLDEPFIVDFLFGKELQPKLLEVDIKNLVTNRLMLTFWALYAISAVYHNKEIYGIANSK